MKISYKMCLMYAILAIGPAVASENTAAPVPQQTPQQVVAIPAVTPAVAQPVTTPQTPTTSLVVQSTVSQPPVATQLPATLEGCMELIKELQKQLSDLWKSQKKLIEIECNALPVMAALPASFINTLSDNVLSVLKQFEKLGLVAVILPNKEVRLTTVDSLSKYTISGENIMTEEKMLQMTEDDVRRWMMYAQPDEDSTKQHAVVPKPEVNSPLTKPTTDAKQESDTPVPVEKPAAEVAGK